MLIALPGYVQSSKPGFRRDLVAQQRVLGTSRFFVVSDPRNHRTLRFTLEGYAVARLLDGQRSLPQLVGVIRRNLGLQMTVDKLHRLIERLDSLGCLTRMESQTESASDRAVTTVLMKKRPRRLTSSMEGFRLPSLPTITPSPRLDRADMYLDSGARRNFPQREGRDESARAVLFASFALVLAALWATWAVLRIL